MSYLPFASTKYKVHSTQYTDQGGVHCHVQTKLSKFQETETCWDARPDTGNVMESSVDWQQAAPTQRE